MNYKKEYHKLKQEIGMLRQLVGEVEMTQDQIYKKLDAIAPLMTKEQKEDANKYLNKIFNK